MKEFIKKAIREFLNENIDSKNKSGIDLVFQQHPELANIGTPEQYSQYLDTIFPNSQVKDIVYHGSKTKKPDDIFVDTHIGKNHKVLRVGPGFYFTKDIKYSKLFGETTFSLINIQKPADFNGENYDSLEELVAAANELRKISDGVIDASENYYYSANEEGLKKSTSHDYIVFKPEQIHVLGSKQDIEGFKNFVKKTIKEFLDENTGDALPKIIDANFFASFGHPNDFRESKKIGGSTDIYDKTNKFKDTEFSIAYQLMNDGLKKLSIHFPHLELKSNRSGAHAGMTFVFGPDVIINNSLIEKLLPTIKKYREDNFTQNSEDNGSWRLNTNNPKEIVAYIPK